jgi:hypothetical protein
MKPVFIFLIFTGILLVMMSVLMVFFCGKCNARLIYFSTFVLIVLAALIPSFKECWDGLFRAARFNEVYAQPCVVMTLFHIGMIGSIVAGLIPVKSAKEDMIALIGGVFLMVTFFIPSDGVSYLSTFSMFDATIRGTTGAWLWYIELIIALVSFVVPFIFIAINPSKRARTFYFIQPAVCLIYLIGVKFSKSVWGDSILTIIAFMKGVQWLFFTAGAIMFLVAGISSRKPANDETIYKKFKKSDLIAKWSGILFVLSFFMPISFSTSTGGFDYVSLFTMSLKYNFYEEHLFRPQIYGQTVFYWMLFFGIALIVTPYLSKKLAAGKKGRIVYFAPFMIVFYSFICVLNIRGWRPPFHIFISGPVITGALYALLMPLRGFNIWQLTLYLAYLGSITAGILAMLQRTDSN